MSISDSKSVIAEMDRVRSRGALQAQKVSTDIQRASDWREYVKAHPIPLIVAAAALGYFAIPQKRILQNPPEAPPASPNSASLERTVPGKKTLTAEANNFIRAWVSTVAVSSLKRFASQQVSAFLERVNDDSHAKPDRSNSGIQPDRNIRT